MVKHHKTENLLTKSLKFTHEPEVKLFLYSLLLLFILVTVAVLLRKAAFNSNPSGPFVTRLFTLVWLGAQTLSLLLPFLTLFNTDIDPSVYFILTAAFILVAYLLQSNINKVASTGNDRAMVLFVKVPDQYPQDDTFAGSKGTWWRYQLGEILYFAASSTFFAGALKMLKKF